MTRRKKLRASRDRPPRVGSSLSKGEKHLDTVDLARLTDAFAQWVEAARRADTRRSRLRLWLIYLLLRYTGARLGEVLALDDQADIDVVAARVRFLGRRAPREVLLPDDAAAEIRLLLADPSLQTLRGHLCRMDQGHIRRKFQERARAAGLPLDLANPTVLRRSRAVELLRGDMPLKVVQHLLGQSSADLTAGFLDFSEKERQRITERLLERESARKTSARNAFFGKVVSVRRGDLQALVELATLGGHTISAIITIDSLQTLGIRRGLLLTAEVKAPWVLVETGDAAPPISASNRLAGVVERVTRGRIVAEVILRLSDDTRVCSVTTAESLKRLALARGGSAWASFSAYSVILKVD